MCIVCPLPICQVQEYLSLDNNPVRLAFSLTHPVLRRPGHLLMLVIGTACSVGGSLDWSGYRNSGWCHHHCRLLRRLQHGLQWGWEAHIRVLPVPSGLLPLDGHGLCHVQVQELREEVGDEARGRRQSPGADSIIEPAACSSVEQCILQHIRKYRLVGTIFWSLDFHDVPQGSLVCHHCVSCLCSNVEYPKSTSCQIHYIGQPTRLDLPNLSFPHKLNHMAYIHRRASF